MKLALRILLYSSFLLISLSLIPQVEASPTGVTGPTVIYPRSTIGAPWDTIRFGINVTDAEFEIANVTLFYSLNESTPSMYHQRVPMELVEGDNRTGSWICEILPQENGTTIFYYASVIDSKGYELSPISRMEESREFRIMVRSPKFNIIYFAIEKVDEKSLTVDIRASFHIYSTKYSDHAPVDLNNEYRDQKRLYINSTDRFEYYEQLDVRGLHLIGDASAFPFDRYYLDLNFSTPISADVDFFQHSIYLGEYSDYYIWDYDYSNLTLKKENSSLINIHINFERKIQNTFYVILPIIFCFFVLGGTYLLDSDKQLRSRLTIYLTLFVFVVGFSTTIKDLVPLYVTGVTVAELTLNWLALYSMIFVISTFFGNFLMKQFDLQESIKRNLVNLTVDVISIEIIFFTFGAVVVSAPHFSGTLLQYIPHLGFKIAIILGLIYGTVINFAFFIHKLYQSRT